MNRNEIISYINELKGYQGYVQFSDRPIDKDKDIFRDFSDIQVEAKKGFIYEAHFYNGVDSITIKQINDSWLVDVTQNTPLDDTQTYIGIDNLKVKMAQIWEEVEDELCEGMKVKKIKKVVFVGFEGDSK